MSHSESQTLFYVDELMWEKSKSTISTILYTFHWPLSITLRGDYHHYIHWQMMIWPQWIMKEQFCGNGYNELQDTRRGDWWDFLQWSTIVMIKLERKERSEKYRRMKRKCFRKRNQGSRRVSKFWPQARSGPPLLCINKTLLKHSHT